MSAISFFHSSTCFSRFSLSLILLRILVESSSSLCSSPSIFRWVAFWRSRSLIKILLSFSSARLDKTLSSRNQFGVTNVHFAGQILNLLLNILCTFSWTRGRQLVFDTFNFLLQTFNLFLKSFYHLPCLPESLEILQVSFCRDKVWRSLKNDVRDFTGLSDSTCLVSSVSRLINRSFTFSDLFLQFRDIL